MIPMMHCLRLLTFLLWSCFLFTVGALLHFLPPPLSVDCSNSQYRVYQRHDNEFRVSCFWEEKLDVKYSKSPGLALEIKGTKPYGQAPPHCQWYQDLVLIKNTNEWAGQVAVNTSLIGKGPHPPWAYIHITVQCVSSLCFSPRCLHNNLSIEIAKQDVRLFLLSPTALPIRECQPVHLGWCARLKSSTWHYRFRSQGSSPSDLLIPSNQHSELPASVVYPHGELQHICALYYSYSIIVRYHHRGFYTATLHIENGPQLGRSLGLYIHPTLLHVFSASSTFLSLPHRAVSLSWALRPLSSRIMAYTLVDVEGVEGWSHTHRYNRFALQSDFCAAPKSQNSKEKVLAHIYFCTSKGKIEELTGKLDLSNTTLIFGSSSTGPTSLTLNPQKVKMGIYIFSHLAGLYYATQEGNSAGTTGEDYSSHHIFYQQRSLCHLITLEYVHSKLFRFSIHVYLNRKETLFRSLGKKDLEVHVYSWHSPDKSLVYIAWFIPVQHPLLQCEWNFSLQLFDSRKEQLLWNNTYSYSNGVKNPTGFLPRSVSSFRPELYTGFVAEVNCTRSGFARAVLTATLSTYISKVMEPTVACQKSYCYELIAVIHKSHFSDYIIRYKRQSAITLQATAKAKCTTNSKIQVEWKVYGLDSANSTPDWTNPIQLNTTGVVFHVPENVLAYGFYHVNVTMIVNLPKYDIKMVESDSVLLQIVRSDLEAVIAGGLSRTVGVSDRWVLDASASCDPDSADPHEGITFNWLCSKRELDYSTMKLSLNAKCHPNQTNIRWINSTSPVQTVEPNTFQENTMYYFLLLILKDQKSAHAFQKVHVLPGPMLVLNVTCVENCGKTVIVTEPFVLAGKCQNCNKAHPTAYLWTLLSASSEEIPFDWASKSTTGRSNPNVRINPFAFADLPDQFYILILKVRTQEGLTAVYEYSFHVNAPVRTGKCVLYPRIGTVLRTKFTVQCSGFEEKNEPLTYKVIASSDPTKMAKTTGLRNNAFGVILYCGHQQKISLPFLPVGVPSNNYTLVIYVQVYDAYGAFSQVTLRASVDNQISQLPGILSDLVGFVTGPNSQLATFLEMKDYLNAGLFAYVVASALNSIDSEAEIKLLKNNLREILLNVSAEIPMTEVYIISQIVSSICEITQQADEIGSRSQLLALKAIKEASKTLKQLSVKGLDSEEAKILGNGIFSTLSNVLTASQLQEGVVDSTVLKEIITVSEMLADIVLQGKVSGEPRTKMETKDWSIHLWKDEKEDVSRAFSGRTSCKNCFYPMLKQDQDTEHPSDAVISTVLYIFEENPFLIKAADFQTAVLGFQMTEADATGSITQINPKVAEVTLASRADDSTIFNLTVGPDKKLFKTTGGFSIEVEEVSKGIFIQIISPMEVTFEVLIYLGLNVTHPPIASYTAFHDKPPASHGITPPIRECEIQTPQILCIPPPLLRSSVRDSRVNASNISVVLQSDPIVRAPTREVVRIAVFKADCLELENSQDVWKEDTCRLGPQTSLSKIHCICESGAHNATITSRQATVSGTRFFAGNLVLTPNPLDINKVLLAEFDTNPVALLTVFFIFSAYISGTMWAIIKDKADLKKKNKILVLPDNDPYFKMRYLVTVYTGSRLGSGTTADVFIELEGQKAISDVHHLKNTHFRSFYRAAIDTFLLTTKYDLGKVVTLNVWHNNSGSSPDWYVSRIKVQNVETRRCWLFLCRSWLGLGRGDGKIQKSFTAKSLKSSLNKIDYFLITLAEDLEDTHIWLSVFTQVVTGSFNRVQRVSCCLVTMLSTLLFNIMFFSGEDEQAVVSVQLRYLKSIYIGFVSALFSIPLQLTITTLFTYSEDRPVTRTVPEKRPRVHFPSLSEMLVEERELIDLPSSDEEDPSLLRPPANSSANNNAEESESDTDVDTRRKRLNLQLLYFFNIPHLPWQCRYIAWAMVFSISLVSATFIILYGLTYGYTTSIEWFIASMTSFAESVILLQTLKLVLISGISTISLKYCDNITWIDPKQYQEMKVLRPNIDIKEKKKFHHELVRIKRSKAYEPLKEDELIVLRKKVRAQHLAFVFVKDIICHLVFSSCILSVAYTTEPTTNFYYNKAIYNKFSVDLFKVNKLEHIYQWMSNVFVPLIHNDYHPTYLSDTWSRILGSPRMRQIRAQNVKKVCFYPSEAANNYVIGQSHCRHQFGVDPEDQSDYLGSWATPSNKRISNHSSIFQGFTYQSDIDQWEYRSYGVVDSYGPGGYSFYFFPAEQRPNTTIRLDNLQKNNWLDELTWAVIFELTTFNQDVDLYCSISIIFETTNVGVVNATLSIHSYKLSVFHYETNSRMFVYGLMIYILVFYLADEFNMLRQERIGYLKTATNLINFAIKTISLFFILLIALKFRMAFTLLELYLLNPEEFVPFHVVSQIDQLYLMITGILAFLLVLKPYRYFRFLYKVRLAEKTLSVAFPEFVYMTVLASVFFFIFASLGYLTIGQYEWRYNSLIHSFQTVISFCFPSNKRTEIISSNRWLGIIFRAFFAVAVILIFINFWRALIIYIYTSMKQPVYEQHSDEAEAINFVVLKIRSMWHSLSRQIPSVYESSPVSTIIFGKPVTRNDNQQGLKTKKVEGKKIVYLTA